MHKILTAQITRFGPPAIVVVAAYQNAGGFFKAESFCVFPEPHAENVFQAFRFEKRSFDNSPVELNDAFMLDEALAQARIDIGLHVQKHYSDKPFLIPDGALELKDADASLLAHLRVRETADFLWDIQNKTDCQSLRDLIEPILALPAISRRRL